MQSSRLFLVAALLAAGALASPAGAQNVIKAFGEQWADGGDVTGYSVSILDDVDGDGIDDWIVGAPHDEDNGVDSGTAYVLTGGYYTNVLFEIHGGAGDNLGTRVASAGDVNKDGKDDFIVTAPGTDNLFPFFQQDVGRVRVYSGATGTVLWTFAGPKTGCRLGESVAGGDDINGDGYPDILAGAPSWDEDVSVSQTTNEGYAALYSGKTGALVTSYTGTGAGDTLGAAVAMVGEINNAHGGEYAIGTPGDDYISGGPFPLLITNGGRVDVYAGITLSLLYTKQGGMGDLLGSAISSAGDTDDDFFDEVLIGSPGDNNGQGSVKLWKGTTGQLVHTFTGLQFTTDEGFGSALAPLGDVNKDGHDDFAIGAPMSTVSLYGGYTLVFSGADFSQYLNTLNASYGGDLAGFALSPRAGDLNGDGWKDLLTAWPYNDSEGADSGLAVGYSFLHFQPDLGFQGPGTATLQMYGTKLFSGGQADIRLTAAAPNSPCWLLASIFQLFSGFKGGILVPATSPAVLVPLTTDATGSFTLPGVPGGNGFLIIYAQVLVKNAGYPQGWGLSNALAIELMP